MYTYTAFLGYLVNVQLRRREDQMRSTLDKLRFDFDDKKKQFESEKLAWEQASGITFEELRRRNLEALSKE